MAPDIKPSTPWSLEGHATYFCKASKGTLAQIDTSKGCAMGEYAKATFHEKENQATEILERVHSYVCGPFSIASSQTSLDSVLSMQT